MLPLTFWGLTFSFVAGLFIGGIYFWGLWWTTQRLPHLRSPGVWLLGSFALRMGLALVGFYLVMQGRPERLLLCMVGFWIARLASVRMVPASPPRSPSKPPETSEESV
ncbi:MAG: ATP synthase subunit I [Myxococcales bacterium]|nr:ATP synthase subunit I [Myxococcales bacterium]MCB9641575.1 ATP synthase subunit I [Myxococcales bacterium]